MSEHFIKVRVVDATPADIDQLVAVLWAVNDTAPGDLHITDVVVTQRGRPRKERPDLRVKVPTGAEADMLNAYMTTDKTLQEIGDPYGVTRERVRQLLSSYDNTMYKLARERRKARTRLRRYVDYGDVQPRRECRLCGAPTNRKSCSREHHDVYTNLRYHFADDDRRQSQQYAIAKHNLKAPHQVPDYQLRHSQRVFNGEETDYHGRWLIVGSQNWQWAVRAYKLGWPVWNKLNPVIQQQIIDFFAEHGDAAVDSRKR